MRILMRLVVWAMVLGGVLSPAALACRVASVFLPKLEQAELIVQGEVVESYPATSLGIGCAYRMRVDSCFKGTLEVGKDVVVWDQYGSVRLANGSISGSTASWGIRNKGGYIFYLAPTQLSEFEQKQLRLEGRSVYEPRRVIRKLDSSVWKNPPVLPRYTCELRMLDLFLENPPQNKRPVYQEFFQNETDVEFLRALVMDWPEPLTEKDRALFKSKLPSLSSHVSLSSLILKKMPDTPFDKEELLAVLKQGGMRQLPSVKERIGLENIEQCQDLLFGWLQTESTSSGFNDTIALLARYSPEYLRNKLKTHELPEWKVMVCLKALEINGSDIGQTDYSPELLSVRSDQLRTIFEFIDGDLSHARTALEYSRIWWSAYWKAALPLFEPILAGADSPQRRVTVALFRTYGVPVERVGGGYVARFDQAPETCPVGLALEAPVTVFSVGDPVTITVRESAITSGRFMSFRGKPNFTVHYEDKGHSPEGLDRQIWDDVDLPREEFVELTEGMVVENEHHIPPGRFKRPGAYRISGMKCYSHDGGNVGVDAWTGMSYGENEVTIQIVDSSRDSTAKVADESSAKRVVEDYIKENEIEVSGLAFIFARRMEAIGKISSLPLDFSSEIWVVRYAPVPEQAQERTLGGGILFWIDAASGKVHVSRELD